MVGILREYGFLFVLAAVGVLSYLYFKQQDRGALEQSLDAVGMQLLSVVGDGEAREAVGGLFEQFKARVLRQEVTPEQVERLAANILNLRRSGERLTAEQAEDVFDIVLGPEVDTHSSGPATQGSNDSLADPLQNVETRLDEPPLPPGLAASKAPKVVRVPTLAIPAKRHGELADPRQRDALGERLQILLDLNDVLKQPQTAQHPLSPELRRFVEVRSEDGAKIVVDVQLKEALAKQSPGDIDRLVRRMESAQMLTWGEEVEESRILHERERKEAVKRSRELQVMLEEQGEAVQIQMARLARYRALQAKGITIPLNIDSLEALLRVSIEEMVRASPPPKGSSPRPPSRP